MRLTLRRSFAALSAEMAAAALELERRLVAFLKQEEAVEAVKVMPDEASFVVEGSGLDGQRWNTRDIAGEGEDISGDVAELGEVERERRRRRGAEFGIEVGEVGVGVPETVIELKEMVFFFYFFFPDFSYFILIPN